MPTTTRASGASSRTATSTATAFSAGQYAWSSRCDEWPWPGRSSATSGRSSASATVSQVCAFCAPPWSRTSSASPSPHTSALICWPVADVDRDTRRPPGRRARRCRTPRRSRGRVRTRRSATAVVDLRARGRCNRAARSTRATAAAAASPSSGRGTPSLITAGSNSYESMSRPVAVTSDHARLRARDQPRA